MIYTFVTRLNENACQLSLLLDCFVKNLRQPSLQNYLFLPLLILNQDLRHIVNQFITVTLTKAQTVKIKFCS